MRLFGGPRPGASRVRVLLTTQDRANPAGGFYAHLGSREVARLTYGADVPYVVLTRDLPWQRDMQVSRSPGGH
jgi:hypothetical protein